MGEDVIANHEEIITMTVTARRPKVDRSETEVGRGGEPTSTTMDRQVLMKGLNHDLAGEYQAILMYIHYSAKLTGPYRRELRALFQAEIGDEQGHAQFLADKIAALGGEPTTEPRPVAQADHPRTMLENALAAEEQAIADYNERIRQAEGFGDFGLKVELENQVADETRHKEELERIIAGWDER
jgi:bacterioferritin